MSRALIVGCGYVGLHLGRRLAAEGHRVSGTTRSPERVAELEAAGIRPLVGPLTDPELRRAIDRTGPEVVFYLVPPQAEADPLEAVLTATGRSPLEGFVYASSTSVYGDRGGDWVDETVALRPQGASAKLRGAAERRLVRAGWDLQTPVRICRIAGIYGPGRTLRRPLERGEYLLVRGHDTWTNRIHVDDIVGGLTAAWRSGRDGRVYNLTDDAPHRASEFAELAAELQDLPRPRPVELAEARRRYGESRLRRKLFSKRVRNRRLREELGVELRYPTFREGLPAAVAAAAPGGA